MTEKEVMLSVTGLSKQYRLGEIGTGTLSHDLTRWWYAIRGKDDPFLKIGESNDRTKKGTSDYVWALREISFEVYKGEVLGIIGKNGAGKSTLLKILSKVTGPSTGTIRSRGRIASLLEVGTGFHQELTGRENIYLNGAILGMTKKEISSKIDEIIAFSGCERYIDTPVKRYSSGMTVRLAFSVAAFLEPEVLIVDEVLAVGDIEFQRKALGKMQDISKGEGRTVLFVSHSMAAVKKLCTRGLLLENGTIAMMGDIDDVVEAYMSSRSEDKPTQRDLDSISLTSFAIYRNGVEADTVKAFEPFSIRLSVKYKTSLPIDMYFEVFIRDPLGGTIACLSSWLNATVIRPTDSVVEVQCEVPLGVSLLEGTYTLDLSISDNVPHIFDAVLNLNVLNSEVTGYSKPVSRKRFGGVYVPNSWSLIQET